MSMLHSRLTEDQREVADLVRDLVPTLPQLDTDTGDAPIEAVREARASLSESGIWSIGINEDLGGGGASHDLLHVALIALGGPQPALAWAIVQADAATQVLSDHAAADRYLEAIVAGTQAVCVVDGEDPHADLREEGDGLVGTIGRLDPCGSGPVVVVLGDADAWVLDPAAIHVSTPRRTSGMAGALTMSADVDGTVGRSTKVSGLDFAALRTRMRLGGAAVAAGLAASAAAASAGYTQERVQFGAALTALPTVRSSLASQDADAMAAIDAVLSETCRGADHAAGVLRDNCERALSVSADAVLSHGGYGYLHEYDVERLVRDAVSLRAATGAHSAFRRAADRFASL